MARPKLSGEGALAAPTEVPRRQNAGSYWFTDANCGSCDEPLWLAGGEYFRNFVVLMRTATSGELSSALVTRTTVPPHIAVGTRIVVMTEDGSYSERAKD